MCMFGKSVNLHSWQVALENENVDLEKSLKNLKKVVAVFCMNPACLCHPHPGCLLGPKRNWSTWT